MIYASGRSSLRFMKAIIMRYSVLNDSRGSVFTCGPGLDVEIMQTKAKKPTKQQQQTNKQTKKQYDQSMTGLSITQITETKRDVTKLIRKEASLPKL